MTDPLPFTIREGGLLPEWLQKYPLPPVGLDCHRCHRVEEGAADPSIKCCDIVPRLPNFLVGALLKTSARAEVRRWIKERRGDPFGIQVPPIVAHQHRVARKAGSFGLPCPFLNAGACSIYAYRPILCVDYHCYYPNMLFREAYACQSSMWMMLEWQTERRLVLSFDLDVIRLAQALETPEDELWEGRGQRPAIYRELWQDWRGQEAAFYTACLERVPSVVSEVAKSEVSITPPSKALRAQYQTGAVPAHTNELDVTTQIGVFLWYQKKLSRSTKPSRLRILTR